MCQEGQVARARLPPYISSPGVVRLATLAHTSGNDREDPVYDADDDDDTFVASVA